MPNEYTKPQTDPTLQKLLEARIKRHGLISSYYKGCRCERCAKALNVQNKRLYKSYKDAIRENSSLRSKYSIECRNWLEEFFPEVAQQIKNEIAGEK